MIGYGTDYTCDPHGEPLPCDKCDQVADRAVPLQRAYAQTFIREYGDRVRYVHPWHRWLAWTGARWEADDRAQERQWMMAVASTKTAEVLGRDYGKRVRDRDAALALARQAESAPFIGGAFTLAAYRPDADAPHWTKFLSRGQPGQNMHDRCCYRRQGGWSS